METYTAIYSHLSRVVLLLLFSTAIQHVVCEVFTIVPSSESTCPEEQICYTLNQYASNSNLSSGLDNITLELQSGTHTLDIPLVVSYISSFEMSGSGNTMTTLHSVDEFSFYEVNFVHLSGIRFINGGSHSSSTSTTQFSVFLVGMFILENSTFQTSKKIANNLYQQSADC